jgi:hypothetical protein
VFPVGTAKVITTATKFRQVKHLLWPHIRAVHRAHGLPGHVDQVQWKMGDEVVAWGFSPADYDETAFSGIHAPHVLVVVDEAGGISPVLGQSLESVMTAGHTRLLVIGNPPVDDETASPWFEERCSSELYNVIRIPVEVTPNWTGEDIGPCRVCPPEVPEHPAASHLVDPDWVADTIAEYGPDSRYVEARVHARFPKGGPSKVIPASWVEDAMDNDEPERSDQMSLGVDVAADGGDELAIARAEGFVVRIVHTSSGAANANAVDVAHRVLMEIQAAEQLCREWHWGKRLRVKIDGIGLGWGVASILKAWGSEGLHSAEIVVVQVSERAQDQARFANKRAEMWWNGRMLIQPRRVGDGYGPCTVRLEIDRRTASQLSLPTYGSNSSGRIVIQAKADLRRKGKHSPDRGEAVLLALYELVTADAGTSADLMASMTWRHR